MWIYGVQIMRDCYTHSLGFSQPYVAVWYSWSICIPCRHRTHWLRSTGHTESALKLDWYITARSLYIYRNILDASESMRLVQGTSKDKTICLVLSSTYCIANSKQEITSEKFTEHKLVVNRFTFLQHFLAPVVYRNNRSGIILRYSLRSSRVHVTHIQCALCFMHYERQTVDYCL